MSPQEHLPALKNTYDTLNFVPYATAPAAAGGQAVNRSSVAALTFLVWDIIITFDDEVKLMWSRPWSYTKFVYFFVRYLPVFVEISILLVGSELTPHFKFTSHDCYIWQVYQGVAANIIVLTVDTILIMRVHALYHGNNLIRRLIALLYVLEAIGMAVSLALGLPKITFDDICLIVDVPWTLGIYAGSSVIFQTILFGLTVWKFIEAARSGWGDVPLIMLLMRDGTWAFFMLFFVYVAQISLFALGNHAFSGLLFGWLLTAFSFAGYRIVLNITYLGTVMPFPQAHQESGSRRTNPHIQFTSLAPAWTQDSYQLTQFTQLTALSSTAQPSQSDFARTSSAHDR